MAGKDLHVARYTPMILTGAFAVLVGALLWGLTDMSFGGVVILAVLILAVGVVGVWMLDKRGRQVA